MEIAGSFLDEEWESLSQIFSGGESLDFFHHFAAAGEIDEALFLNIHGGEDMPPPPPPCFDGGAAFDSMMMNFPMLPNDDAIMEDFHLRIQNDENSPDFETADSMKRKLSEAADDDKSEVYPPSKKSRNGVKNRRVQPKKGKKMLQDKKNEEEIINGCSSYSSEEDSQELNEEIKNSKSSSSSKTRASRGSATDPQSLYARKRRERINERLKILQNLVPNGTKVDISTMLEEAVQYVKFLQLQIKLLSSDNMWMYAPLAYNGMDIGIYEKLCPNMRQ